jgi:hypothetical protein
LRSLPATARSTVVRCAGVTGIGHARTVNTFFRDKLTAVPSINEHILGMQGERA